MKILISFISFVVVVTTVSLVTKYQKLPQNNKRFNMEKAEKSHREKVAEYQKLEEQRLERLQPKKVVEVVADNKPLVVLDTPELKRGSELYAKCIVCHGKRGEGKKSQNAPKIGGQLDWYLLQQLVNMKSRVRMNKKMDPYIRKLNTQDFEDLAQYISKLPW